ncbi:hypothetical protein LDB25A_033 [Lactobacillus phage Ld25A]|uniref:Uncharacterized protein n=1 Tax=Lactobacillus phage Ld25A TaxID=1500734 RepID=A0A075KL16_9CAUD|nr:replication initiation protein [Lactobacillus phage Ld25A]AIF54357.1 hypothetical protein LDB25A_033 [Lactobacillus phage Ld25A]
MSLHRFNAELVKNCFHVKVAKECGVNAAVLFTEIAYEVEKNRTEGINLHAGRYWTFKSNKSFSEQFPYFSERQVKTALKKLEDSGLVMSGNYNSTPFDRTKWYTLTKKGYSFL